VIVVAHHRIRRHIDGEHSGQLMQPVHDPATAVLIALSAHGIRATQEGTAHAAIDEVIPGRGFQRDKGGTRLSHDGDRQAGFIST